MIFEWIAWAFVLAGIIVLPFTKSGALFFIAIAIHFWIIGYMMENELTYRWFFTTLGCIFIFAYLFNMWIA